jgi:hypothetical protein
MTNYEKELNSSYDVMKRAHDERGLEFMTREQFGKLHGPTKGNNFDGMFSRIQVAKKLNAAKPSAAMTFKPEVKKTNLTAEKAAAHKAERIALGDTLPATPEQVKLAKATAKVILSKVQSDILVTRIAELVKFIPKDTEVGQYKRVIAKIAETELAKLQKEIAPKVKLSMIDQILAERGWKSTGKY